MKLKALQASTFRRTVVLMVLAGLMVVLSGCEEDAKRKSVAGPPVVPSGIPDITFNGQGFITLGNATSGVNRDDVGQALAIDGSGRILVAGYRSQTGGGDLGDMAVWCLTPSGALDTAFGIGGVATYDSGTGNLDQAIDMTLDGLGRIVVAGFTFAAGQSDEFTVWRLQPNGAFDTGFNATGARVFTNLGGGAGTDRAQGIATDSTNRILAAGRGFNGGESDAFLQRMVALDGSDDASFGTAGRVSAATPMDEDFSAVITDSADNVLTVGWEFNGAQWTPTVRRYLALDGSLDLNFNAAGAPPGLLRLPDATTNPTPLLSYRFRMKEDAAGNIVIVGTNEFAPSNNDAMVWRVTSAGALDTTFGGTGYVRLGDSAASLNQAWDFDFDAKGNILVAGEANLVNSGPGVRWMTLWRLLPNGQLDGSFGIGGFSGLVQYTNAAGGSGDDGAFAVRVQPNGRIVVAGYSTSATNGKELAVWRFQ